MSGGSWNYFCHQLDDVANRMVAEKDPLRRAFGEHLRNVAKALHDVEWVDSFDSSPGSERAAIELCLGKNSKSMELEIVKSDARKIIEQLNGLL